MASSAHDARWIGVEAAMAVIALNTPHRTGRVGERLQTALAGLLDAFDGFASHRTRLVAGEAEQIRPRQPQDTPRSDGSTTVSAEFRALDPDIVSEAIPAFFIGRNKEGFWVARDAKGRNGGIFLLESSATSFARRNSRPAGCATIYPLERFELDLKNNGNPLVPPLASLLRVTMRPMRRIAVSVEKWRTRSNAA
jgi:hypothetical protein